MKPHLQDEPLKLKEMDLVKADYHIEGTRSTQEMLQFSHSLYQVSQITNAPELKEKALSWLRQIYTQNQPAHNVPFSQGPYMKMATAYTEFEIQSSLNDVLLEMNEALPRIQGLVEKLPGPIAPKKFKLHDALPAVQDFAKKIVLQLPQLQLSPLIEESFTQELISTVTQTSRDAAPLLAQYEKLRTFNQSLQFIKNGSLALKIKLSKDDLTQLSKGQKIADSIGQISNSQGALSAIITIWENLTPQERKENFEAANQDLYNFLRGQSSEELKCLKTAGCWGGLIDGIKKKAFVLPKIEKYGVLRIKTEMDQACLTYVKELLEIKTREFISDLPHLFSSGIAEAWISKENKIALVRNNVQAYVDRVSQSWADRNLSASKGTISAFESDRVQVTRSSENGLSIQMVPQESNLLSGVSLGTGLTSLSLLTQSMASPQSDGAALPLALGLINKITAIAGYKDSKGQLEPALLSPVPPNLLEMDIADFEAIRSTSLSYRIPDRIPMHNGFRKRRLVPSESDFSAQAFADQIYGLSESLAFTADWKESSFDTILSPILAQDLTTDAQSPSLLRPLFPKDLLGSLNIGITSVLLLEITKPLSPVFLLTVDDKVIWAHEYEKSSADIPIMAGVVDLQGNSRSQVMKSRDNAALIMALSRFLNVTEEIEKTKSALLLLKNPRGTRPLDTLLSARSDLRMLIIALANLLSQKMVSHNDLINSEFNLTSQKSVETNSYSLRDQVAVIEALIETYQLTGIEAYVWRAEAIYYSMNKHLYNPDSGFYQNAGGPTLSATERINTVKTLLRLRPYLPEKSRPQLDRILGPWTKALLKL